MYSIFVYCSFCLVGSAAVPVNCFPFKENDPDSDPVVHSMICRHWRLRGLFQILKHENSFDYQYTLGIT